MINKTLLFLHQKGIHLKGGSGLDVLPEDTRDFGFASLFDNFFGYTPKEQKKILPMMSNKDQRRLSNCVFQSTTALKEPDEGVILSAQNMTARAYYNGLCGWGGWANLRNGMEVLIKFGVGEQIGGENTHLDFGAYVAGGNMKATDAEHKSKSYWRIKNADEYLKAIDEGFRVELGMDWYTGFNQGGGFSAPWLVTKPVGVFKGGHAIAGKGYDMSRQAAVIHNSYSGAWADNGDFYIDLDYLNTCIRKYGAYCQLDIEYGKRITTKDIIEKYDNKNIRGDKDGAIYRIQAGAKAYFANKDAFAKINNFPYNVTNAFTMVPQESIDAVPWYGGTREKSRLMGDGTQITPWDFMIDVNANWKKDFDANKLTKNAIIIGDEN